MEFDFRDRDVFVSHWMLQDINVAKAISETPEWKDGMKTTAKVTVNGVELPFESLENFMQYHYDRVTKEAEEKYSDLDKEVERRLKQRLKREAQTVIDKLYDFTNALNDIETIIVPYWEKNGLSNGS